MSESLFWFLLGAVFGQFRLKSSSPCNVLCFGKWSQNLRIIEALVFPVVTYGSETWAIRKAEMKKIEAFELWVWRRLLRVPWTSRRTNEWVLGQIKTER